MDEHTEKQIQQYYRAFDQLIHCSAKWQRITCSKEGAGEDLENARNTYVEFLKNDML